MAQFELARDQERMLWRSAVSASLSIETYLVAMALAGFTLLLVVEKKRPYKKFAASGLKRSFSTNTSAFLFNTLVNEYSIGDKLVGYRCKLFTLRPAKEPSRRSPKMDPLFCAVRLRCLCLALPRSQIGTSLALSQNPS